MPPDARLGDAPHLQALQAPEPRLDLRPRHILQQDRPQTWPGRAGRAARGGAAAALVHLGFAAGFLYLLSFRDAERPREVETPVEVVVEPAEPVKPAGAAGRGPKAQDPKDAGGQPAGGPAADPTKPPAPGGPDADPAKPVSAGAQSPEPPKAPAASQEAKAIAAPAQPPPAAAKGGGKPAAKPAAPPPGQPASLPKLIAPPPDAARAATQDRDNKPANLVPDEHQADGATREAKPVEVPPVLTTGDPRAAFAVPATAKPPTPKVDNPTPATTAKAPSETDKLAAALPMDTSAMPMSFRAVLAGNAATQTAAAYSGIVQGRLERAKQAISDAAYAQSLRGRVSVLFTLDDAGHVVDLRVVESSGDARLDALALQWIQSAAPFPPPPPEAEHTYRKALIFGG